ncbi:MAG: carboxypeptidase-like regulatory domain-containing protein, partial [Bacteroidota bacterium]
MSENGKHMNRYTSSDIQKYVEGKLSAQEMHEMEKAALDDPFLADAIEGFGYISSTQSEATIKKDTEELHQRLHGRVSGKKKSSSIAFIRLKIAAVAIIILGIAGLTFNSILNKSLPKENVARFKPSNNVSDSVIQHDKATTIQTQKDSETAGNIDSSMQPASAKPKKERSRKASAKNATDKEIQETMEESEPEIRKKEIASFKKENADMAKSGEPGFRLDSIKTKPTAALEPGEALQGKVAGVEISHNRLKTLNRNFISGRVVDANNQPVAGASVFSKNKKTAALTNNDGIFKLNNSNNNPTIDVQVNSIGFQPATATLSNN